MGDCKNTLSDSSASCIPPIKATGAGVSMVRGHVETGSTQQSCLCYQLSEHWDREEPQGKGTDHRAQLLRLTGTDLRQYYYYIQHNTFGETATLIQYLL